MVKFKEDKAYEKKEKKFQKEGNKAYLHHEEKEVAKTKKAEKEVKKTHKGKDGKTHPGMKSGCKKCGAK